MSSSNNLATMVYGSLFLHKSGLQVDPANIRILYQSLNLPLNEVQLEFFLESIAGINLDEIQSLTPSTPVSGQTTPERVPEPVQTPQQEEEDESVGDLFSF